MKKIVTILFSLIAIMASAEEMKLALLQPRVAEGSAACNPMEINMVRGELRKAFGRQSDFQVLTRTDVDAMLQEQGFQRSGMVDDEQRKQVGVMTGAKYVCVSTITKYGTQLYIESYLVDVETGQMTNPATQYANVKNEDYSTLPIACGELAKEMLGEISGSPRKSKKVDEATTTQSSLSSSSSSQTFSSSAHSVDGYIDLGLPSGTLWKDSNEDGYYDYKRAMSFHGDHLPTMEQFDELRTSCIWTWNGNGYTIMGPNKQSIFMPAAGSQNPKSGKLLNIGKGIYYSSSTYESKVAFGLYFDSKMVGRFAMKLNFTGSVRLVK